MMEFSSFIKRLSKEERIETYTRREKLTAEDFLPMEKVGVTAEKSGYLIFRA